MCMCNRLFLNKIINYMAKSRTYDEASQSSKFLYTIIMIIIYIY